MNNKEKCVAIWCEGIDRFYSIKPIVSALRQRDISVKIYTIGTIIQLFVVKLTIFIRMI